MIEFISIQIASFQYFASGEVCASKWFRGSSSTTKVTKSSPNDFLVLCLSEGSFLLYSPRERAGPLIVVASPSSPPQSPKESRKAVAPPPPPQSCCQLSSLFLIFSWFFLTLAEQQLLPHLCNQHVIGLGHISTNGPAKPKRNSPRKENIKIHIFFNRFHS